MQLTRAADYAVRVMMHLATLGPGAYLARPILAASNGVPESFLSKILQALSRAGLVSSRRGLEGGFALLPRGREASLLEVVEAVDGPISLNLCLAADSACENHSWCAAHIVWAEAQQAMLRVLRGAKLTELSVQSAARRHTLYAPKPSTPAVTTAVARGQATTASRRSPSGSGKR
jgi:Rrf2 family protein